MSTEMTTDQSTSVQFRPTTKTSIPQSDSINQGIPQTACYVSKNVFLTSLALLAVVVAVLIILVLYIIYVKKKQNDEITEKDRATSKATVELDYEDIEKVETDVYVEAECVKVHRIVNNKNIKFEKAQNDEAQNEKVQYVNLQNKKIKTTNAYTVL